MRHLRLLGVVYLLLFIPVYVGTSALGMLGILVVFLGVFLASVGSAWRGLPAPLTPPSGSVSPPDSGAPPAMPVPPARYGGVIMLGPIPIVFGSDARIAKWMMILGLILAGFVIASFVILSLSGLP